MMTMRSGLVAAGGAAVLTAAVLGSLGGAQAATSTGSVEAAATFPGTAPPPAEPQSVVGWCEVGESLAHAEWTVEWADSATWPEGAQVPAAEDAVDIRSSQATSESTEYGVREGWRVDFQILDLHGQFLSVAVMVSCER